MSSNFIENSDYYKSLTSYSGNVVKISPVFRNGNISAGKGLVNGSTPIQEGKVLYLETALGTLQHSRNLAFVCEHCKRFIGTLEDQIKKLVTVKLSPAQKAALSSAKVEKLEKRYQKLFPPLPSTFQLPAISPGESVLSPVFECIYSCGDSYCSIDCKNDAWRKYHALLCTSLHKVNHSSVDKLSKDNTIDGTMHDEDEEDDDDNNDDDNDDDNAEIEDDKEEMECEGIIVDEYNDGESDVEVNAAALFQHQALATNEIFSLAGRMYCRVLEGWIRNGNDLMRALEPFRALHAQPWSQLFALQQEGLSMRQQFETKMAKLEGIDSIITDDSMIGEINESEEEKATSLKRLQETINEWLNDSVTILKSLVVSRLAEFVAAVQSASASRGRRGATASSGDGSREGEKGVSSSRTTLTTIEIEILFSPRTYEMLIGAFELNNIEMKIDSPLRDYMSTIVAGLSPNQRVDALSSLSPVLRQIVKAKEARQELSDEAKKILGDDEFEDDENDDDDKDEDDDDDSSQKDEVILAPDSFGPAICINLKTLFPSCNGTALFALTCCANHSCVPNVQLQYNEDSTGVLVALRDLEPHEELCINYVGLEQPTELRQADLRHYGFTCSCERCEAK